MLEFYDSSTEVIVNSLLSESHKRRYRCCYKRLREYLANNNVKYSHEMAIEWLKTVPNKYPKSCYSTYRTAVYRLDAYCESGNLLKPSRNFPLENAPLYVRLSEWSRKLLDDTLKIVDYCESGKNSYRIAVAEFLFYLEENGAFNKESITMALFRKYIVYLKEKWKYSVFRVRINYVFTFFSIILPTPYSTLFFNYNARSPLPIFEELNSDDQLKLCKANTDKQIFTNIQNAIDHVDFVVNITAGTISKENLEKRKKKLYSFLLFLTINDLNYTEAVAKYWCNIVGIEKLPLVSDVKKLKQAVHFSMLTDSTKEYNKEELSSAINEWKHYSQNKPEDFLPEWSRNLILDFCNVERRKGKKETTINVTKYACVKFCKFLEEKGIHSCSGISPHILSSFNSQDYHKTNEGKKTTNSRIRRFIAYLGDVGAVATSLYLALPCKVAPQIRTVKILNEKEIETLYLSKENAKTPVDFRDSAIVFIALRMGLRAGDICSLKFENIDWKRQEIHIVQGKTDKALTLPMPIEVGNCIFRYIKDGRPNVNTDIIFLSHRFPFMPLTSHECAAGLSRMLKNSESKYGFHILRKTCASRMLKAGTRVDDIVNLLGHDGNHTIMKYLSVDSDKMRLCSISAERLVINDE